MMMLKTVMTGAVSAAALFALTVGGASAQSLSLRISGENPMSGNDLKMAERFAELLEEKLGDDFEYELFHTQALGGAQTHLQMIRSGQIDVYPMGSDAVTLDGKWAIFDMPFLFSDRETVSELLDGDVGDQLAESMRESAGIEVLAFGELGFRQITNNVRPIVTPEDLEGVQLRVPGSPARILAFETFGAQPITMAFSELYLALQQGTVDGQENPLLAIKNRSLFEVQDYLSMSNHVYSPVTFVMNGGTYDSLTDAQRQAVEEAALEAAKYTRQLGADADARLLDELSDSMEVNEIDLEAFQEASVPIWEEVGAMAGSDFAQMVIDRASQ
jgi:tripartite ATP-independent transporter DctP family solute receptor